MIDINAEQIIIKHETMFGEAVAVITRTPDSIALSISAPMITHTIEIQKSVVIEKLKDLLLWIQK